MSIMTFCTLFDSYYLDKGIALYNSLERTSGEQFRLYIFCFDDRSFDVLQDLNFRRAILIKSEVLDNPTMDRLKKERSKAEYCWTCTPQIIEYVLDNYDEDSVTYIDADLYFFDNPHLLFDEINNSKANVVIVEHRFPDNYSGRRMLRRSGKYCVEFNYFNRSDYSRECLAWWKEKCIEWCYHLYEPDRMGDQKYLEQFPKLFHGVHELKNVGGGVAPWNLSRYRLSDNASSDNTIVLQEKNTGLKFGLIFYHFQNIRYLDNGYVNIYSGTHDVILKKQIYLPYLTEIEAIREKLREKDIYFSAKKSYSSNRFMAFAQTTILRYKIKSLSDIFNLNKLR